MTIFIKNLLPLEQRAQKPSQQGDIPFGRIPTDHILIMDFLPEKGGWQIPEIQPFQSWSIRPDALVFHYGQQIFEGLKAYKDQKGEIRLFRPELNGKRFYRSAQLMGMEPVPVDLFVQCIKEIVSVDKEWVLDAPGSLYIRPLLIPLDYGVSYRASSSYRFAVMLSPAKNYFGHDKSVSVMVERHRVRSVLGAVGEAKAGGNYGGCVSLLSQAKQKGLDHVLWLDGATRTYIEEVGAMNIMFVYHDGTIVTSPLTGSILAGVTRQSLIDLGLVKERKLLVDEMLSQVETGKIVEAFGCGTAAVISPIGKFVDGEKEYIVGDGNPGLISKSLKDRLLGIQLGYSKEKEEWSQKI